MIAHTPARDLHRLDFVQHRLTQVRREQVEHIARATDVMTSQHYRDETDPSASRALCEALGQARQDGKTLDAYLDEFTKLRAKVA